MFPAPDLLNDLLSPDSVPAPNDGTDTRREVPSSSLDPNRARTYGDNNVDLPEELQHVLLSLVQEAQRQDLYQRRIEVMRDRRNRFYERGIQHIYEDLRTGMFVQGTPGALVPDPQGDGMLQCGQCLNDYDIFGRALQILIAKLTENPVGVDFQPDSAADTADRQAAEAAEAYRVLYDRRNDNKDLLTAIVRMMGVSGRVITWTRTVADAQRWGFDEFNRPMRGEITSVYGTLESKVPILARSLSDCPYCILTEDPHLYLAKMEYPLFAEKIAGQGDDGIADTQFERMARIGVLQGNTASYQITDTYNWYVEKKYAWFRPAMFMEKLCDRAFRDDEFHFAEDWTVRDALNEAFPRGAMVTFIGSQYVASRNISIDDELSVDFPYAGDGMSRRAIMDPAVVIQDDFNDDMNNYHEVKIVGWPSIWINQDVRDLAAINDQAAAPYCFRALKTQPARDARMEDQFFREPDPNIPASFFQHTEYMVTQLLQYVLSIPSAVQGAGMSDQKTAAGYQMALNQALGQLGVIWAAIQRLMANIYRQAALAATRDEDERKLVVIPGPRGASIMVDMAKLAEGRFLCHPDVDSGYPESTLQKRSTLSSILDIASRNPILAQGLFQSPDNWDFFARTMGIPEITLPEAKARRKQIAEIELLLRQPVIGPAPQELAAAQANYAVQASQAPPGGSKPLPFDIGNLQQSTIPPDPLDFHEWEFEECREFLSDWSKVQEQIVSGNASGVQNVRAHALEHQRYMAQQQQALAQQQVAVAGHLPDVQGRLPGGSPPPSGVGAPSEPPAGALSPTQ